MCVLSLPDDVGPPVAVEVADTHIAPLDAFGPIAPQGGMKALATGRGDHPLTGFLAARGEVRLAVAVEVADASVLPVVDMIPLAPQRRIEALAG